MFWLFWYVELVPRVCVHPTVTSCMDAVTALKTMIYVYRKCKQHDKILLSVFYVDICGQSIWKRILKSIDESSFVKGGEERVRNTITRIITDI
jgi:hypothetical protein